MSYRPIYSAEETVRIDALLEELKAIEEENAPADASPAFLRDWRQRLLAKLHELNAVLDKKPVPNAHS